MRILVLYIVTFFILQVAQAQQGQGLIKISSVTNKVIQSATAPNSATLSLDRPIKNGKEVKQDFQYELPVSGLATVYIRSQLIAKDTVALYDLVFNEVVFRKNAGRCRLNLSRSDSNNYVNYVFFDIIKNVEIFPPGIYTTDLGIKFNDTDYSISQTFYWEVDSTLSENSLLTNKIEQQLTGTVKRRSKNRSLAGKEQFFSKNPDVFAERLNRKIGKKSMVDFVPEQKGDHAYSTAFYKGWFLGRFEIPERGKNKQILPLKRNISITKNSFTDFTSVSSQIKDLAPDNEQDNRTSKGAIEVGAYFSNGQEPGSEQENNYQEFRGEYNTYILKLPVSIEGYYTTQDRNRIAKASYIRLHYDTDESKKKLTDKVNLFKRSYQGALSQRNSYNKIYQPYIEKLKAQESGLRSWFKKTCDIEYTDLIQYDGDVDKLLDSYSKKGDSALLKKRERIQRNKETIHKNYTKLQELNNTRAKYEKLLNQYRSGLYFDSLKTYAKLQELTKHDVSYKRLLKASEGILTDVKKNKFINGLTSLDLGILNKYESKYTMSGQVLKGASGGYDLGFVQVSGSIGKTEYISRDGGVDRYNNYIGRLDFKPIQKQNLSFIYYSYTPTKQVFASDDFRKDIVIPNLKNPIQIISVTYSGVIGKNLLLQSEGATSFKTKSSTKRVMKDNSAMLLGGEYFIPKTSLSVNGEAEHIGSDFQNSAIPYIKAATTRYTIGGKILAFRSFLSVGIQYNFFKQETFASTGYNKKWGFDVQTNTRRYPSIYVSYKPFSTFRRFDDTLSAQQRPLVGEVWIARSVYQLKHDKDIHRFMAVYNSNSNTQDTQSYKSTTMQLAYIANVGRNSLNTNVGWTEIPVSTNFTNDRTSYFINLTLGRSIAGGFRINIGEDIAWGKSGIQRLATNAGCSYQLESIPLGFRAQFRYTKLLRNTFINSPDDLWYGYLGFTWQLIDKQNS